MTDLTKWNEEDLQYEICDMFADWIDRKYANAIQDTYPIQLENFYESIKPYVDEFRRRHPFTGEFDENGNGKFV